jgi:hypothetical protein
MRTLEGIEATPKSTDVIATMTILSQS